MPKTIYIKIFVPKSFQHMRERRTGEFSVFRFPKISIWKANVWWEKRGQVYQLKHRLIKNSGSRNADRTIYSFSPPIYPWIFWVLPPLSLCLCVLCICSSWNFQFRHTKLIRRQLVSPSAKNIKKGPTNFGMKAKLSQFFGMYFWGLKITSSWLKWEAMGGVMLK